VIQISPKQTEDYQIHDEASRGKVLVTEANRPEATKANRSFSKEILFNQSFSYLKQCMAI
jgi:hypothetical protein